jgi:SNF2 family DNA or RNA helicase
VSRPFTPHEYQALGSQFLLATPKAALYADMGMGKTSMVLSILDKLLHAGYDEPILVLAPLRVARDTWRQEAAKWSDFSSLRISPIVGTTEQRARALNAKADIHTCNYEQLEWLVDRVGAGKWPWRMVVADESTRLKGYRLKQGGKRARALGLVARHANRWINLSGTPVANGLKDLWGATWFLDQGERLGRTYTGFEQRWFRKKYSGFGIEPFDHSEKEIHERIADITMSLRAEDWFDLKKPKVNEVRVYLPEPLKRQYKQLENDLFTTLACGTHIEVFNAGALTNKCLQFSAGAVYTKAPKWTQVHDLKLQALESIVNESGGKQLLVAYEFQSDRERILKRFPQSVDISKAEGVKAWMAGDKQIGVAHPASMGHGIDGMQHNCWTLVYFSHGWAMDLRDQILERIGPVRQFQGGYDRLVEVYSIICDGTLDDDVIERHKSKRSVQDALMHAMSRRKA